MTTGSAETRGNGNALDTIIYWIDAADRLVRVNDAWERFAVMNGAPELTTAAILGLPLWHFIADSMTKNVYHALLQRAKQGYPARFRLRCDAPDLRRELEMSVLADRHGIRFESRILRVEPRSRQAIFDRVTPRSGAWVRACSWCNRLEVPGGWEEAESAVASLGLFNAEPLPMLTHVICPSCTRIIVASSQTS